MHLLFSLIIFFLMKEVDSQNDPGDGLDAELNTNKQEIDLSAMGPNLASPVALGYPAANQDDMAESISPEIALADLGVGTAFSSVTKDSGAPDSADSLAKLSEPEYPVVNLANTISSQSDWGALDHGNAVIADEDCSFGDTLAKLAKPKPKPEGWVAPKPTNPDDAQEGQYRFCARNPAILIDGLRRRNCVKSLDTFCAWGRVDLPIVDNCIGYQHAHHFEGICDEMGNFFCCERILFNPRFNLIRGLGKCNGCQRLFEEE